MRNLGILLGIMTGVGMLWSAVPASDTRKAGNLSGAHWIWVAEGEIGAGALGHFRLEFELPAEPLEATVVISADNGYELHVNGNLVAAELDSTSDAWATAERFRVEDFLHARTNVIAIKGECLGGSAGVVADVLITTADGVERSWVSDETWLATANTEPNWTAADHDDSLWEPARVLGQMGCRPWGKLAVSGSITDPKSLTVTRTGLGAAASAREPARFSDPGAGYSWPSGIVFIRGRGPDHSTKAETTKFSIPGTGSYFEYDTPAPSVSGRQLCAMLPAKPGGSLRLLHDAGDGLIASPTCSYDGNEIVFAMVPEGEKFFKLFRIGIDGLGLRQLTHGPWQDYEPAILPDGRIVFASSRAGSRDEYHANTARSLFVLSADRRRVEPFTWHIVADSEPAVMPDGRVAFVRHDNFMQRAKVETRIHVVRPDGTGGQTLIGADRGKIQYDRLTAAEYPHQWLRNYGFGSPAPLPVPADRALAIQAVDAEGRPVVNEMSWIYVRPGERRSCTGCHERRNASPDLQGSPPLASLMPPVDLSLKVGGDPHRFRANNAANGGVLNLQFDRFREAASIDLYRQEALPPGADPRSLPPGRAFEVAQCIRMLGEGDAAEKEAAAQRLAIFRDRSATPALIDALTESDNSVRLAAALALAACGTRAAVPALIRVLNDPSPAVGQAACISLEHLTGHAEEINSEFEDRRSSGADHWRRWLASLEWDDVERDLITRLRSEDRVTMHLAIESLGHVGSAAGRAALREFLESGKKHLRIQLAVIRALGHLRDRASVPLLIEILDKNMALVDVKPAQSHEFGWSAPPDHLAATAAEALGWIGSREVGEQLAAAYLRLDEFWSYTYRTGDHDWLMGCHSSIIHYRIAEALDAMDFRPSAEQATALSARLLESVPIDTDRGLLYENDAFETVTGRLIQRMGMGPRVIDTCLSALGDPGVICDPDLERAVATSPPAKSVGPLSSEARAAQLLSLVCLQSEDAPRVRAAFERYHAMKPSRERSWICFFLARTLGKLRDGASVSLLRDVLENDPSEFSFGIPDPPNVFIHKAMTPVYRAAAADALGRIGEASAVPSLLAVVNDYENAMEVREAAARALGELCDARSLSEVHALSIAYPEIATRRTLADAYRKAVARLAKIDGTKE